MLGEFSKIVELKRTITMRLCLFFETVPALSHHFLSERRLVKKGHILYLSATFYMKWNYVLIEGNSCVTLF